MNLTLMRSDLMLALMACIQDCTRLLEGYPLGREVPGCVAKARECRKVCLDCLEALESAQTEIRGSLVVAVKLTCLSLIQECEQYGNPAAERCIASCRRCIEECGHVLA